MELNYDKPKVKLSIGLPVYNGEQFIRNSINSILSQTFTDFELIISDNASTDATQQICEEYAIQDQRIKYVRKPQTVSIVDNFVTVLELARGDYFMWATHDDYYETNNHIAALYNRIKEGFTFVFPNSNIMIADNKGHITYYKRNVYHGLHRSYGSKYEMSKDFVKVYGHYLYGMHIYGMFKTDKLRKMVDLLRKYNNPSSYHAEGSFLHKLFSCERSSYVETVNFNYVYHGKNESANISPHILLLYYLYYTYFVISIYLSSSFSSYEKLSILFLVAKIHSYKLLWLIISTLEYFYSKCSMTFFNLYKTVVKA
jgi:glycosyltransferase involved in cell wall biosynthesis